MAKKQLTFEEAMERLEEIVDMLEGGEFPLEKSLELFEEGVGLVKLCNERLSKVENSMKVHLSESGELTEEVFGNE